ncbi:hypothetical protein P8452_42430 [Trifolium repens]|nr:hypothetical protein P8452_42430 [Trifolium repens]
MDFFISLAGKVAEYMVEPIGRQFGYILYYKGNLAKMKTDVQNLEGIKDIVQHTVDEARRTGEEIENIVKNWLITVDNTNAEANKLIHTEDHAKAQCSMGHFSNICTRYKLSRKTKKMIQEISQLLVERKFDRISYRAASHVTVPPFRRSFQALHSRTSMLNDIMLALKNPNIFIIGVYGMGGVGKTTLVKELAWQAENDGSFSAVATATITDSPDVEKIQGQIADALDLKFNKETKEGRAAQLRERITKEKSILVILDDIWGRFDLTDLGFPFGNDHKGCKLVVTSRDLNVLNCEIGTQKEFRLEVLLEDDSWELFEKMAGDVVQEFNIKPIAEKVAKCCAGLPLLIVTVAKALRKKDVSDWKDALNELERFDQEGLHKKVYSTLELSYNCLESEELKLLFLFIGSSGVDHIHTGELFSCSWGFGIYRHARTLTHARNRCYKLINDLKASSLLLESKTEFVYMHDVVREVAKSIASRLHPIYGVQRYTVLKKWPKIDQLQKLDAIVVPWSYIHELPEKLDCPELKLLVLQTIGDYLKIPGEFFSVTRELKVLDLYGMMLTPSPPHSLHLLTNIQSLALSGCVLADISIVAELKSLEILSLEKSDIIELPKEIGQLANLRMLNLTSCSRLRFIPANLLSSLTCLEELYMGNCFIQWNVKGSKDQSNNASLDELSNLSHLTSLDITIQDASVWPMDLQIFAKLERYNIFIGDMWKWSLQMAGGASESSRTLKLMESDSSSILLDSGFNFLLNSAVDMCLVRLQCGKDVLFELNKEGFPQVKHLCIQDSVELKFIINSVGWIHPYPAFLGLETLVLQNLFNLEEICHGPIPIQSLTKLKSIEVKEIVAVQTSEADKDINKVMFPMLRSLELERLPSLVSFCSVPLTAGQSTPLGLIDKKVGMPHLELLKLSNINSRKLWDDNLPVAIELVNLHYLGISNCAMMEEIFVSDRKLGSLPSQKPLSGDEVIFPNLETLEISHMEHLKTVWHNQLAPNSFRKLKQLKIESCNKLSNVFPSYVLDKLQNLETVTVSDCHALEFVFETQGLKADGGRQTGLEMKLGTLTLKHLPMLKHIWSGNPNKILNFQNLCQLKVIGCQNLNHVFPLCVAKELQHLQVLHIEECGIEIIVAQDGIADTTPMLNFPKLITLCFRELTQLRSFYHVSYTLNCPVLRDVDVFHCDNLILFKPKSLNNRGSVSVDTLPLLSIEKVVTNTKELILTCKDVTVLCSGQLNDEPIYTVKALCLRCFHDGSDNFPYGFIQRFINLENLKVSCSSFTEIFSSGSFGTEHSETKVKLRKLVLVELKNLEFICKEKYEVHVLQNIEILEVSKCSRLKNIVPSSVLFGNLEKLMVSYCAGLENIMKSSVINNIQKLRILCIDGSEKIEEIIASDDMNDASELAFMKLEYLRLDNLPRLRSFCKGKHSFKFPLLQRLLVIDCPMMETFSHGVLNAPKLRAVHVKRKDEWHWNGDINSTIRKFVAKKGNNSKDDCVCPQNLNGDSSR